MKKLLFFFLLLTAAVGAAAQVVGSQLPAFVQVATYQSDSSGTVTQQDTTVECQPGIHWLSHLFWWAMPGRSGVKLFAGNPANPDTSWFVGQQYSLRFGGVDSFRTLVFAYDFQPWGIGDSSRLEVRVVNDADGTYRVVDTLVTPQSWATNDTVSASVVVSLARDERIVLRVVNDPIGSALFNRSGSTFFGWCVLETWMVSGLPVTYQAPLSAKLKGGGVQLSWVTATEVATDKFIVDRMVGNSASWEAVGEVTAAGWSEGATSYTFEDDLIGVEASQHVYYRLRQMDIDGGVAFSDVVGTYLPARFVKSEGAQVDISSALMGGRVVGVNVAGLEIGQQFTLTVTDMLGRKVFQHQGAYAQVAGAPTVSVSSLPAGRYAAQVIADTGSYLGSALVEFR